MADVATMLSICDPIHLVLIKTNAAGDTTLVSSNFFEWRPLLAAKNGHLNVSIELKGTGKIILLFEKNTHLFLILIFL